MTLFPKYLALLSIRLTLSQRDKNRTNSVTLVLAAIFIEKSVKLSVSCLTVFDKRVNLSGFVSLVSVDTLQLSLPPKRQCLYPFGTPIGYLIRAFGSGIEKFAP